MKRFLPMLALAALSSCMNHGGHGALPPAPALIHPAPGPEIPAAPLAGDDNPDPAIVELRLTAAATQVGYLGAEPTEAWAYNGSVPGPTIVARRGDTVVVHFRNDLPEPTTIHWHGVRVANDMDGAGRLLQPIPAGGTFEYRFVVPDAGLYWYHPHVRSDVQVGKGLYGAIIVRDPAEPGLDVADERVLVLDDVFVDPGTGLATDHHDMRGMMMGDEGNLLLVNGRASNGAVTVAAGARTRLRLVNAATARFFRLGFDGGTMTQIGSDGGLLVSPRPADDVLLVPGERVDLVLETSTGGVLAARRYERARGAGASEAAALVRIVLSGAPAITPAPLPDTLRAIDVLAPPVPRHTSRLGEWMAHHVWQFTIDGQVFPNVPALDAAVGSRLLWRVQNESDMDHPFHVHGFFFQRRGVAEWKDTLDVPSQSTLELVADFAARDGAIGDWMYHCHILEHAEGGMMGEVRVR